MHVFRPLNRNSIHRSHRPVIESLESRTLLSASGTPSLVATVPGPLPSMAVAGAKVNDHVEVTIDNIGTGKSSGRTTITLFAVPTGNNNNPEVQIGSLKESLTIPAGSTKEFKVSVPMIPQSLDGEYNVLADVTAPNATADGTSSTSVDVSPPFIDLSDAITSVPATARIGAKTSVTLDVTNHGNVTATGKLDTLFDLSANSDGSDPFQVANVTAHISIKPGVTAILHLSVPVALGSPSGDQFIVAVVDPQDVFNDTNPDNNTAVSATPVSYH